MRHVLCFDTKAATTIMEAPEITFMFQFGSIRNAVTVCASQLNLRSLKKLACQFIETNVSGSSRVC